MEIGVNQSLREIGDSVEANLLHKPLFYSTFTDTGGMQGPISLSGSQPQTLTRPSQAVAP